MSLFWKVMYLLDGSMHLQVELFPFVIRLTLFDYKEYKKSPPEIYKKAGWVEQ